MWLLKSCWSNLMKHLIPYLQNDQKAADYLRQLRWPNGVICPRCGSAAVESRERCDNGLQRFNCVPCAARLGQQFAMFTDWTSSIFEEIRLSRFKLAGPPTPRDTAASNAYAIMHDSLGPVGICSLIGINSNPIPIRR